MPEPVTTAVIASTAVNFLGGLFGRRSASKARKAEQAFLKKKYEEYDYPSWLYQGMKLDADWQHKQDGIDIARENERLLGEYKTKNANNQYGHALAIHRFQEDKLREQYEKSEKLYQGALGLNERSAQAAKDDLARKWDETVMEYSYEDENRMIESLLADGAARAQGKAGVTAQKASQVRAMELGVDQAINHQSLMSAGLQTEADLRDIQYQKQAADMQADAQRMLKPRQAPGPIRPLAAPQGILQDLRPLQQFDYGVAPIMGVATTQVPSWGSVLANAAGAGISAYATYSTGKSSFDPNSAPSGQKYGPMASDVELKENITYMKKSPDGHSIYEWNYKGEPKSRRYQGVMAQELLQTAPHAVFEMENGYLGVNYNLIDVNMSHV